MRSGSTRSPIHLAFVGFGENGHVAFNDSHVADFADPVTIRRVVMDDASRKQQAGEGHFDSPASVQHAALTVTCSALMRAAYLDAESASLLRHNC